MSRYAFPAAPSAVADAPKAAAFLPEAFLVEAFAFEAVAVEALADAFAVGAIDGARS
ncbi:hypothetical protein ABZZ20_00250 [Streptomyces sp. NPDC006430]|uniref:hypothetical protein n=1 Tax=Streptomyces sp. NPDC006430 TaxID=3154299 RepID=UPI0033AD2676